MLEASCGLLEITKQGRIVETEEVMTSYPSISGDLTASEDEIKTMFKAYQSLVHKRIILTPWFKKEVVLC